jgi:hypothetical protein
MVLPSLEKASPNPSKGGGLVLALLGIGSSLLGGRLPLLLEGLGEAFSKEGNYKTC